MPGERSCLPCFGGWAETGTRSRWLRFIDTQLGWREQDLFPEHDLVERRAAGRDFVERALDGARWAIGLVEAALDDDYAAHAADGLRGRVAMGVWMAPVGVGRVVIWDLVLAVELGARIDVNEDAV